MVCGSIRGCVQPLTGASHMHTGGPTYAWVKARFGISDDGGSTELTDPKTRFRRVFVRATIADNPYLRGDEYERQL